jgi:hypothetical protein
VRAVGNAQCKGLAKGGGTEGERGTQEGERGEREWRKWRRIGRIFATGREGERKVKDGRDEGETGNGGLACGLLLRELLLHGAHLLFHFSRARSLLLGLETRRLELGLERRHLWPRHQLCQLQTITRNAEVGEARLMSGSLQFSHAYAHEN